MKRVVIVAAIFTCFLTSSIQSITWKNYVTQNGIPKVVNGRLDLSYKDLEDIDFKDIEDIKTLKYLDLSYNCRLQKLPADLSSLANLEILILNSTKLQELPSSIGQLENLKEQRQLASLKSWKKLIFTTTDYEHCQMGLAGSEM